MIQHRAWLVLLLSGAICPFLSAQPTTAPAALGRSPVDDGLAPKFESPAGGVSLRPPVGMKVTRGGLGGSEVVRFVNEEKKWLIILSQIQLEQNKPLPLTTWRDTKGQTQPGMLEVTIDQFKTLTPGSTMLREFADDAKPQQVGFMAAKYNMGLETTLTQQAIIRASNLRYYILTFNSPAPREKELETDPAVKYAVDLFGKMVESVELFDQTDIRQDQDERLFRTRTLFVNFTEAKLRSSLIHEQWFRFIKDGKDVGYSYVIQEIARDIPRRGKIDATNSPEGVLVGVRSRLLPEPGAQTDAESWFFMSFDRKTESFSTVVYSQSPRSNPVTSGEVGVTRFREKPVPVGPENTPKRDMMLADNYRIEVTRVGRNVGSEPVVRDLPPYYIPQALYHLLPSALPRHEQKTYLFASWITEVGQLMYRYLDVGAEQEINFAGKHVRAIPIKDKIGLEGSTTTHYITLDGQYLGSTNPEAHMTTLASDAATIGKLWADSDLTRPAAVEPGK